MKILKLLAITLLITSCTVSPKVVHDPDNNSCHLETKKRALKIKEELKGNADALSIAVGSIYTAATAVVSGSIVLVGNTIHWLEKQGKCDDAFIRESYNAYLKPLISSGGIVVDENKGN